MEDLIIVRRKRNHSGQYDSISRPLIKIERPRGTFVVFQKTMETINAAPGDAVMFAFSKKEMCAFIYKELPQQDSYFLSNITRGYSRFTCKELMLFFIEFFEIDHEKNVYFEVSDIPNIHGKYKLSLI